MQPEILMGEAGICGFQAMLAIAWMIGTGTNNTFYGWDNNPSPTAKYIAINWANHPNPFPSATHVFSEQDLQADLVQALAKKGRLIKRIPCIKGLALNFYQIPR